MVSKCLKCGYGREACNDLICPRCNSVMVFEGCGSCSRCNVRIFSKEKRNKENAPSLQKL